MGEAMIVRRGGFGSGGGGFSPNDAVLKVITSTGCTVTVIGTGYSQTHQDGDGFPRSDDANVTEHFFSIPASAFGTLTVVATNTYGDNTKTITVNTDGKVYELFCGGVNIILDSTFGLQDGFTIAAPSIWLYNERYKRIERVSRGNVILLFYQAVNVTPYEYFTVNSSSTGSGYVRLRDADSVDLATCDFNTSGYRDVTAAIEGKYYPTAQIYTAYDLNNITKIVLS